MIRSSLRWILLFSAIICLAKGANITINPSCFGAEAIDGSYYSIRTLVEKGKLSFDYKDAQNKSYVLSLSVCSNDMCFGRQAAACLCSKGISNNCLAYYPFGEFSDSNVSPMSDGAGVEITYKSSGNPYWTKLTLLCDYGSIGAQNYEMTLQRDSNGFMESAWITVRTEAACPIQMVVSGGTIFMLIIISGATLYLIVGVIYNKFSLMKEGREVLPHSEFWFDLPNLVKEGAAYSFGRCGRREPAAQSYENVTA